jgi:ribose 5-phosphate isomerase A
MTTMNIEHEKRLAAEAAAELVEPGMTIGLGTGSTVAFLLPALARRRLSLRCVASSPRTEQLARDLGLRVGSFGGIDRLGLVIDGADQIAPDGWLVKGGGAAHTREKILAAAGDRFVIIADSRKPVPRLHGPVPLELLPFGLAATLRRLEPTTLRNVPRSPDGGIIADYRGAFDDPATLAAWLDATPGLVAHGLFPASMVTDAFVARGDSVERIVFGPRSSGVPSEPSVPRGGFRPTGDRET